MQKNKKNKKKDKQKDTKDPQKLKVQLLSNLT